MDLHGFRGHGVAQQDVLVRLLHHVQIPADTTRKTREFGGSNASNRQNSVFLVLQYSGNPHSHHCRCNCPLHIVIIILSLSRFLLR